MSRDFQISRRDGDCPCRGCPDRKSGCHDHCRKYQAWSDEGMHINRNRRAYTADQNQAFRHSEQRRKKYEFTGEVKQRLGRTLHQIRAVVSFGTVKEGEIGGWIEKEENLGHEGNAWVYGNAHYLTVGPIGSRSGFTTFFRTKSLEIGASCGCFRGATSMRLPQRCGRPTVTMTTPGGTPLQSSWQRPALT